MQESRLFRILYYLLDKGHATAPELAEKFEVSVRTIYRDVDAISSAGIPIYVTTGRNGGIRFLDDYVLDKSFFSDSEKLEILSSLQSLSAVQYPEVETVLKKLGAIFQIGLTDWIDVDFSRWGSVAESENSIQDSLPYLEAELSLFPNVKVIMLMGDVAKKAFNMITKKATKKNVVPTVSTYKLRTTEIYYKGIRVMPSYIMTGGNILIEKSKVAMATEDIATMLEIIK